MVQARRYSSGIVKWNQWTLRKHILINSNNWHVKFYMKKVNGKCKIQESWQFHVQHKWQAVIPIVQNTKHTSEETNSHWFQVQDGGHKIPKLRQTNVKFKGRSVWSHWSKQILKLEETQEVSLLFKCNSYHRMTNESVSKLFTEEKIIKNNYRLSPHIL